MRGVRIAAIAAAVALGAMVACSSFSSTDDAPGGAEAGSEAGGVDGTSPPLDGSSDTATPADAASDARVNLLSNGDFELACSAWNAENASLGPSSDPALVHGGMGSCVVCNNNNLIYLAFTTVAVDAPPGSQFYGGAWIRSAPDGSAPAALQTSLQVGASEGGTLQSDVTAAPAIDATYAQATALINVTADGGAQVGLSFRTSDIKTCFILDDAWLYRTK